MTDWGTLGLGTWIDDVKLTLDDAVGGVDGLRERHRRVEPAPPPRARSSMTPTERATQQFIEGGVVGTTDTILTGFGFEGMSAAQRPEFMKRALKYLGVLKNTRRRRRWRWRR